MFDQIRRDHQGIQSGGRPPSSPQLPFSNSMFHIITQTRLWPRRTHLRKRETVFDSHDHKRKNGIIVVVYHLQCHISTRYASHPSPGRKEEEKKNERTTLTRCHFSRANARLAHAHLRKLSRQPRRTSAHAGTSRPSARGAPLLVAGRRAGGPVRIRQRVLALVVVGLGVHPSWRRGGFRTGQRCD